LETACNIGPSQQRRRLIVGMPLLFAGVVASFLTRSVLAQLIAFLGLLTVLQVPTQTCVALALRGEKNLDQGPVRLDDPAEIAFFRRRALQVVALALLATLLLWAASRAWFRFARA
jgi:hypothetical protein